jgi:signal transduction histidine kinase
VSARQVQDFWEFSVRDNGQGFPEKDAERIFSPFERGHTHEVAGAGIGLATCRRIVTRYGGAIWAESKPGEGSTFKFTLPAA